MAELFVDKIAAKALLGDREPPVSARSTHAADLYLALGCTLGNPIALRAFDEDVLEVAARSIRRYDGSHAFVTEVLQRVRIHLLVSEDGSPPRIARYDGRASVRAWVGTCAVRMALYVMRGARNAHEVEWSDVIADLPTGHAELDDVRARHADVFRTAWREACRQLSPRHRAILKMSFVEGCGIDQIAATYAVHRVTVWRWLDDAKARVLAATRVQLGELLPDEPGTQSLLDLIGSKLELGLSILT